jgi:hypothetical protein
MILEEQVIDLAIFAHRVEVETLQRREPFVVKLPEALATSRRDSNWVRARQAATIDCVAFDRAAHLADVFFSLGGDMKRKTAE